MVKLTDIYLSVKNLLKDRYKIKIYGNEVTEGFKTPSFFIAIYPIIHTHESINIVKKAYTITITYFADCKDQIDELNKIDEIEDLFGSKLSARDRMITVTNYSFNYVGINSDILQLSIDIEFMDNTNRKNSYVTAKDIYVNLKEKR